MGEFFKGGRRKAGCVVLAMALVIAVEWLRSYYNQENLTVYRGQESYLIHSREGRLYWMREQISYGRFELWSTSSLSIVPPLTLLSAGLLLWPGKRVTKQVSSSEGA